MALLWNLLFFLNFQVAIFFMMLTMHLDFSIFSYDIKLWQMEKHSQYHFLFTFGCHFSTTMITLYFRLKLVLLSSRRFILRCLPILRHFMVHSWFLMKLKFDKQWPPYKILERVKVGKWKRIDFVFIFMTFFGGGGGVK